MKGEAFSAPPHPSSVLMAPPVSPCARPLPVNDSLHFTLQEPRKTLWPFPVRSEEIARPEKRGVTEPSEFVGRGCRRVERN